MARRPYHLRMDLKAVDDLMHNLGPDAQPGEAESDWLEELASQLSLAESMEGDGDLVLEVPTVAEYDSGMHFFRWHPLEEGPTSGRCEGCGADPGARHHWNCPLVGR